MGTEGLNESGALTTNTTPRSSDVAAVSTESAERYEWGGVCEGWHLLKHPALSVIQERVPPGAGEVRHHHRFARQFFWILAGTATLEIDGTIVIVDAGRGIHVPPCVPHRFSNNADQEVVFLVISAPTTLGDRTNDHPP